MIFAAACGNDNGGGSGTGNDPGAANYLALFNRAVEVLEEEGFDVEVLYGSAIAGLGMPPSIIRVAFVEGADGFVVIYLFNTNANAAAMAAEEAAHGYSIVGLSGRVAFDSNSQELVDLIIDEIGGAVVTA